VYSVIIADDEERILNDIEMILANNRFEYKNVYKVRNGIEAKKIMEQDESVRLILSDISMPGFDGIQLLEYVKQCKKNIFVVLVTGYAKFEYAKRAIDLGAAGFILKPISEQELCDCVIKIHSQIKRELKDYEKYNIKLVESVARMLLETGRCTDAEREYISEVCNLNDMSEIYLIMLKSISDDDTILNYVNGSLEKYTSHQCKLFPFHGYEKGELLCLCVVMYKGTSIRKEIFDIADLLAEVSGKIYISVSGASNMLLPAMYQQCQDAYYEKISNPQQHIFLYQARKNYNPEDILVQAKLLEKAIFLDDECGAEACVRKMFATYLNARNAIYFRDIYKIAVNTIELCKKTPLQEDVTGDEKSQFDCIIETAESVDAVVAYLCQYIRLHCVSQSDSLINMQAVIEYVDGNFMNELTLEEIGKLFHIAPNYLSRRFKKCTGESFIQYINRKRIEKAIELLERTEIKVVTIAEMVGFQDNQYFHKLFKKKIGVTPIEYRMNVRA